MIIELVGTLKGYLTVGTILVAAFAVQLRRVSRAKERLPLPPGPKGLPIIGNLLQIPTEKPWRIFNEWAKEYGDIIYLEALGQRILILNSLEAIKSLLVSRATNYSDRPDGPLLDLVKIRDTSFAVGMNYGQPGREHRREFHRFYNQSQIHRFHPIMEEEMATYLSRLLQNPNGFREETQLLLGMIIMRASYGAEDPEYNRNLVHSAEKLVEGFLTYTAPGRLLVNIFPSLRYVPSWFPGAGWKRIIEDLGRTADEIINHPFDAAEERMKAGFRSAYVNISGELIESLPDVKVDEAVHKHRRTVARNVAAQGYIAGIDTTFSTCSALCLALAMHPELQRKAQIEIDAVVGSQRLPTCRDIEHLPYLQAILKEVARWHTVVALSIPRATASEDIFNGFRIPANTVVLSNAWAIMHDQKIFENPMEFRPERFLKAGRLNPVVLDPEEVAFGFGRRICPGRHMSNDALCLLLASLLACFDIKPEKDDDGRQIELEYDVPSSLITAPLPYKCEIVPRSDRHRALLER